MPSPRGGDDVDGIAAEVGGQRGRERLLEPAGTEHPTHRADRESVVIGMGDAAKRRRDAERELARRGSGDRRRDGIAGFG